MEKEIQKELRYEGYFIMDSGYRFYFDISAEDGGENYDNLYGKSEFKWEQNENIYCQTETQEDVFLLANKVIGFSIRQYNQELD